MRILIVFLLLLMPVPAAAAAGDAPSGTTPDLTRVIPSPLPSTINHGIQTVALDYGHGGKEPGARGSSGLLEKDLTLDLGEKVRKELMRLGFRVVLTRESDYFVGLKERTAIANHALADLFLSLHANASTRPDIDGFETYHLSFDATDEEAAKLARMENASLEGSGDRESGEPSLGAILWDMVQTEYEQNSAEFASRLQSQMAREVEGRSRGVRQAPLAVLMGAQMPAVLLEVGFISNPGEELRLKGEAAQERIARAIARAVSEYNQVLISSGTPAPGTDPEPGSPGRTQ